jgi:hypothetical protein
MDDWLKRLDGEQARRGNVGTSRNTLRSTLEDAGLCTKGLSGDLKEWIPRIKDPEFFGTISEPLQVIEQTLVLYSFCK